MLTYSIDDAQGNVVSSAQQVMLPDDPDDDEGWRTITSLTAYVELDSVSEGAKVIFKGHVEDAAGHVLDATGEATVHGEVEN